MIHTIFCICINWISFVSFLSCIDCTSFWGGGSHLCWWAQISLVPRNITVLWVILPFVKLIITAVQRDRTDWVTKHLKSCVLRCYCFKYLWYENLGPFNSHKDWIENLYDDSTPCTKFRFNLVIVTSIIMEVSTLSAVHIVSALMF